MKTTPALFAVLSPALFLASLVAQDGKQPPAGEMPSPKHAQHEPLRALAGNWEVVMRTDGMPGVPGMEKPTETKGSERAELLHDGLWLRSIMEGTHDGKPFQGVWLAGYDPFAKQYVGIWLSSDEKEPPCQMTGSYDAANKTWTWKGKTPHGDMRSETKFDGADSFVETCYMSNGGKETKAMEITRKRTTAAAARPGDASSAKPPAELAALHKDIGQWTATVRCSAGGEAMPEEKGSESVAAICNGRWLWSDFKGQFQGQQFTGNAIYGIDPTTKKIVSIWIDSMSPTWCRTEGAAPAGNGAITLTGSCVDPTGKPMQVTQTITRPDDNTRTFRMEMTCDKGPSSMEITYNRKS